MRISDWSSDVCSSDLRRIDTYSAHADQQDLQRWIKARQPIDGSLFLSHGESGSIETFRRLLQADEAATSIIAPQLGETYALPARASARRLKTGDPELQGAVGRDWQNDYADFSIRLKKELPRSEEHTSELQSLMRNSYAVF